MFDSQASDSHGRIDELARQIDAVHSRLQSLETRFARIEAERGAVEAEPLISEPASLSNEPTPEPICSRSMPLPLVTYDPEQDEKRSAGRAADETGAAAPNEPPPSLESRIGSLWLNRIGIVALLIGVVSLLTYSFQFFGAPFKIACGYLVAAAVIVCSRKLKIPDSKRWFSEGLNALGWSIAYFTGYAMYFIPDLRVMPFLPLELVCLTALAAGTMYDAIRSDSEATAVLSTTLASVSICLCAASLNPFLALLVILVGVVVIGIRQKWHALLFAATAVFYAAFNWNIASLPGTLMDNARLGFGSLMLGWLAVQASTCFAKAVSPATRKAIVLTSLVNAIAFSYLGHVVMLPMFPASYMADAWLFLLTGGLYVYIGFQPQRQGYEDLRSLNILLGLFLVNGAKWSWVTGEALAVTDLLQILLLVCASLAFDLRVVRYFACFLACGTLGNIVTSDMRIALLATLIHTASAYIHRSSAFAHVQTSTEQKVLSNFYYTFANIALASGIGHASGIFGDYRGFFYLLQVIANTSLAVRLKESYMNVVAAIMMLVNIVFLLFVAAEPVVPASVLSIAGLYLAGHYYRRLYAGTNDAWANSYKQTYGVFGTMLLTWLLWHSLPMQLISAGLGLEGMCLIAAGFMLREKLYRVGGLIVFALLAVHLLFFDLASAPTIARIVSFIVSGLVLVGCSYAYAWFTKQMAVENDVQAGAAG